MLGYTKTLETKVLRVKHRIGFRVGMSQVRDVISLLQNVPPDAAIVEVSSDYADDPDLVTIEFHEERKIEG